MHVRPRSSTSGASGSRTRSIPGRAKRRYFSSSATAHPKAITPSPPRASLPPVVLDEALGALAAGLRALGAPRASLRLLVARAPRRQRAHARQAADPLVQAIRARLGDPPDPRPFGGEQPRTL